MPYDKRRSDQSVWTYKYAPPRTRLDPERRKQHGPKFPQGLTDFTSTVYYYWWQFLRLSAAYQTCCERMERQESTDDLPRHLPELYRDFGWVPSQVTSPADIQKEDTEALFSEWWRGRGWVLFVEPQETGKVTSGRNLPEAHDPNTCLALSVPLDMDISTAIHMIEQQLRRAVHDNAHINPNRSWAIYRVKSHKIEALDRYLKVKRAQLHFQQQKDRLPTMAELRDEVADKATLAFYQTDRHEAEIRRKRIEEELVAADAIIHHVEFGVFPFTKRPNEYLANPEAQLPPLAAYKRHDLSELNRLGWTDKSSPPLAIWRK